MFAKTVRIQPVVLGLLALASLDVALALAQAGEAPPRPFLRKVIEWGDQQLAALDKGEVVTRQLPGADKPEIAAFGAVKIAATRAKFVERVSDIKDFRKVPQVPEMGVFGTPAKLEDMAALTLEDGDFDVMRKCVPGNCNFKLGAAGIERLQKEVKFDAPDAKAKVLGILKDQAVAYVNAYRQGGTDAMGALATRKEPRLLSSEFKLLLKQSPYLPEYLPALNAYIDAYPKGTLTGAKDIIFWTKDTFGLKPVLSIYHLTVWNDPAQKGAVVAIKQLYASHYFNAGLDLIVAVDADGGKSLYLLELYRGRIDPPTGMLAGVLLGKVRGGVETAVAENLKHARVKLQGK
jgi:hypothetical protein